MNNYPYLTCFRVAYIGTGFAGVVSQPGKETVESVFLSMVEKAERGLKSYREEEMEERRYLRFSSRTDKGVSALDNLVIVAHKAPPQAVAFYVNSSSPPIWITAYASVKNIISVKKGFKKRYRYFLPFQLVEGGRDAEVRLRAAAELLKGEHDFRYFSKKDRKKFFGSFTTKITLEDVDVVPFERGFFLDFSGKKFLWEMVRRCVGAMWDFAEGRVEERTLRKLLSGLPPDPSNTAYRPRPSPPEYLILWKTIPPSDFTEAPFVSLTPSLREHLVDHITSEMNSAVIFYHFHKTLLSRI